MADSSLVIYDGVCHLCNGFVRFIIKRDHKKRFQFGYLQSPANQSRLKSFPQIANELDSVVLLEEGRAFTRSTAALRIVKHLGGGWPLFYAFIVVPSFLRDAVYNLISRYRYRLFGKSDRCILPSPEHQDRFMD